MPRKGFARAARDDGLAQAARVQLPHAVGHRALAGKHHALGAPHGVRVARDDDRASRRDVLERLRDRAQVAHAVVDDGDVGHVGLEQNVRAPMPKALRLEPPTASPLVDGDAGEPRVGLDRHAQRARERLEHRLGLVVRVVAAQVVDVQRHQRVIDEALEELVREVDVELADPRARERDVELEPGPAREIDHDARQRLVERHVGVAVAAHAFLVADRLRERLAERDADVLDRVVRVDVQVALRASTSRSKHAVARDLVEHVVEERHAGRELASGPCRRGRAATVICVSSGVALDALRGRMGRSARASCRARRARSAEEASFSAGVPTVTRRQFASSGCRPCRFLHQDAALLAVAETRHGVGHAHSMKLASLGNAVDAAAAPRARSSTRRARP